MRPREIFGFVWDGALVWQSQRATAYALALEQLRGSGDVFACACTRRELADADIHSVAADGASLYPGICLNLCSDCNEEMGEGEEVKTSRCLRVLSQPDTCLSMYVYETPLVGNTWEY